MRMERLLLRSWAAVAALGCLAVVLIVGRTAGPGALMQSQTYDGLYHLHQVPRKRLVRPLGDPMPAFVPSQPSRQDLVMQAAKDRNRVDAIELQLAKAKEQMLSAHIAAAHRGLMAPSPHGSARLLRLLRHEKQDEKKALAMASADFAPAEHRTQLIPDYTYKRGGSAGDDSSSTQKTPAGDYYGQNYDGGVHTGTNGAVSREARSVLRENAAQERAERDVHRGALGALDVVPEKDENVLGSLGGVEAFDSRNRDGVLLAPEVASTDRNVMMNLERKHYRNTMGSLFSVHAPSNAEDAADAKMKRPRNALSFRYRQGHWSHDGLLWIVGDGRRAPQFHAQESLKSQTSDASRGGDAAKHIKDQHAAPRDRAALTVSAAGASPAEAASAIDAGEARIRQLQAEEAAVEDKLSTLAAPAPKATAAPMPSHASNRVAASDAKRAKSGASSASSSSTLSTGPLSLKRLIKDFGQYEAAFGAFFGDDAHARHKPRFSHAKIPHGDIPSAALV